MIPYCKVLTVCS